MRTNRLTDTLEPHPNGSRYWRMTYPHAGAEKRLAIAVYPEVTLGEARKLIANGTDPSAVRKATKSADEVKAEAKRKQAAGLPGPAPFEHVAREWLKRVR